MAAPKLYNKNKYNLLYTQMSNESQRKIDSDIHLYSIFTKHLGNDWGDGHSSHSVNICQIFNKTNVAKEIILVWITFFIQVLGILLWVSR